MVIIDGILLIPTTTGVTCCAMSSLWLSLSALSWTLLLLAGFTEALTSWFSCSWSDIFELLEALGLIPWLLTGVLCASGVLLSVTTYVWAAGPRLMWAIELWGLCTPSDIWCVPGVFLGNHVGNERRALLPYNEQNSKNIDFHKKPNFNFRIIYHLGIINKYNVANNSLYSLLL